MNLLAIDCATSACSAALWLDGEPGPARRAVMQRGHAEVLMPMVAEIMAEAGLDFAGLSAVAVTTGPGAFTGIRIGLSAARGFALAAGLPLIGVTTLEAVSAAQDSVGQALLVALDSKRDDIYVQMFGPDGTAWGEPRSLPVDEMDAILPPGQTVTLAGDMADAVLAAQAHRDPPLLRLDGRDLPDAAVIAAIAAGRFALNPPLPNAPPPAALYLRPPDAKTLDERRAAAK